MNKNNLDNMFHIYLVILASTKFTQITKPHSEKALTKKLCTS